MTHEWLLVLVAATVVSLLAFAYCFAHHLLLLYGDAVAHLHIARRVFDSMNPGFRQLGSVWLPLPHLLLLPFVQRMEWWQSGVAGAFPSMVCYIAACVGIYRLARLWLARRASLLALAFFALNPGLLYLQSTAMTEPLFLAEMIWTALLVAQFTLELDRLLSGHQSQTHASRLLLAAGVVLVAAVYTRYDGWIYASLAWLVVAVALGRRGNLREPVLGSFVLFTVMLAAAPALWLLYNAKQFGDPLDFIRGPYSASAIALKTTAPGASHYPGWHNMRVAGHYFLKAAELGAVPVAWGKALLALTIAGTVLAIYECRSRAISAALLLWFPLPFYAYSVAYGSVPIFIPVWWPHSWYNVRYGLEMLPVFALFAAFVVGWLLDWIEASHRRLGPWLLAAALMLIAGNTAVLLRARPIVFEEGFNNSRTRIPFEAALCNALRALPPEGLILMYTSEHPGALERAGIPLRRTINESDYYHFNPTLADPAKSARWVVATEGDVVDKAVKQNPDQLELISVTCSTGQPCARIYRSHVESPEAPTAVGR